MRAALQTTIPIRYAPKHRYEVHRADIFVVLPACVRGPSPQEVRRTQMKIFVLAKRRYYTSFWLPGPETLFPIDLHGERVVCKSLGNFF